MARLVDLLDPAGIVWARGSTEIEVTGVATDSRRVEPGNVFICLPGYDAPGGESLSDRHSFAERAIARGAVAVVVERDIEISESITIVAVRDPWSAAAAAAARFHRHPSRELLTVGITGTSGKTSTSYFIDSILRAAGHRVARFGTIDYRIGNEILVAEQTTPEAPVVHGLLRRAVDADCTAVAMEVSSHALELRRVGDVRFGVAVFTNLSRDHLNFHPDMESYRTAKARLFSGLSNDGVAIVNADDEHWQHMVEGVSAPLIRFGLGSDLEVTAAAVRTSMAGIDFELRIPTGAATVRLRHLGDYNVHNALAAAAVGVHLGLEAEQIATALAAAETVPGRFEVVEAGQGFVVVVDYAHKPVALERLLESARRVGPKRLITVVGCGGDRDRGKRPLMGEIAAANSEIVVVTSDNPRTEDPNAIIEDILEGSRRLDPDLSRHVVEVDRAAAIRAAIELADDGDMVVIAGKGHEPYQVIGSERRDFDDREQARAAIQSRDR